MMIRHLVASALLLAALDLTGGAARAQGMTLDGRPPFYARLSNIRPLVFGMDVGAGVGGAEAAAAICLRPARRRNLSRASAISGAAD